MDDDLGDFFSEIEKVESNVVTTDKPASLTNDDTTASVPKSEKEVVAAPVVAVAVASAKAVPNITYAAPRPSTVSKESSDSSSRVSEPPTHSHTHTSSAAPSVNPPLPPTPYGSAPYIMTGSQMQAAMQPAAPLPTIPTQKKKFVRAGAGEVWVDDTLNEWPANDFRLFVGDLGNEVSTEMLAKEFQKYSSFAKAKVVRGGWNNKSKGYGFVSFLDPFDCAKALREMNGKYLGNRPMKIRKSTWKDQDLHEVKKKDKKKRKMAESLGL